MLGFPIVHVSSVVLPTACLVCERTPGEQPRTGFHCLLLYMGRAASAPRPQQEQPGLFLAGRVAAKDFARVFSMVLAARVLRGGGAKRPFSAPPRQPASLVSVLGPFPRRWTRVTKGEEAVLRVLEQFMCPVKTTSVHMTSASPVTVAERRSPIEFPRST